MHPELTRSLITERCNEIQRQRGRYRATPTRRPANRLRRRSGWLLIEIGLRLANPATHSAG